MGPLASPLASRREVANPALLAGSCAPSDATHPPLPFFFSSSGGRR